MPDLIQSYLRTLRSELGFDPGLAGRVSAEVEEHLLDLTEEEGQDEAAARRAIARMGDARTLAAGMALATLPHRMALTWRTVALSAFAVFLAMRLRNILMPVDGDALQVALAVDRFAYWAALAIGIAGWYFMPSPRDFSRESRVVVPVCLCAAGLAISGGAGVYLFVKTIAAGGLTWSMALPLFAASLEWTVLAIVFGTLFGLARHARSAARPERFAAP